MLRFQKIFNGILVQRKLPSNTMTKSSSELYSFIRARQRRTNLVRLKRSIASTDKDRTSYPTILSHIYIVRSRCNIDLGSLPPKTCLRKTCHKKHATTIDANRLFVRFLLSRSYDIIFVASVGLREIGRLCRLCGAGCAKREIFARRSKTRTIA